uniref:WAC domain-containing protein n=1 Tax=Mesocestoides corti TaxID=53468 RepID=A0A5K3F5X2_MESCO
MPLLNGEQFVKQQPPPNLDPNEEVFFSPITYEVFRDYDEFFERTILLNSLTWSCSFCGKRQLTYTEAQACEQADENQLATFGVGLSRGLLHIMLHSRRRRLSELVDLLVSFSVSRFFVGEKLNVKRPDNSLEHFVVVERVILPPQPGQSKNNSEDTESEGSSVSEVSGMPDPKSIKYVVRSASPTDESTGSTLILPSSALQRPARNYINRDRIKFFIRQTGQLESQIFVPRESLLRHFNLYPKGSLRWADIFADPELRWFDLTPPRTASGRDKVVHSKGLLKGAPRSGKTSENSCGLTKSVGGSANQQSSESTWDAQRLTRIERMELERTWSLLRKRDDLDLSDLVPLPSFTPLRLRLIPLEDFGTCLQVYEFYHVFGGLLRLPVPGFASQATDGAAASPSASSIGQPCLMSDEETGERSARLTWDVLEEVLLSTDPMGPLADVLLGLLGAIRRLENETNGRQLPPTAEAAAASTVSAIATLEAGLPLAYAGILTGLGSSQEYSTMLTESLLCDHALALIFRGAADTTRQAELVGVPPAHPALTSRAERAALALGGQAAAAASVGGGAPDAPTPNRSAAVRACALACAVGAASLPPLDRAGLADALWLHITTAPAKAGGWRGGIWGGTRPLDDPCVELIRRHKDLVDKLRVDPIYSWSLRERLTLITTLMDELLMQPQLRERMDEGFERVRQLRLQLRGIQAERYKLYGGNANIANMLYGFSPSTLISSCDNWLTGTPPILRNNMNRPRKKTIEAAKAKIAAEYSNAKGSATDSDSQKAGSEAEGETSAPPPPPPINTFSKELEVEEQELWASVLKTARRFSMIPLGQDRVYRRYWLVMSLPAILIEDTLQELSSTRATSMTPAKKTEGTSVQPLRVRGRQVCASATLGSSPAQAARTIQQAIDTLLTNSLEDEQWQNPRLLDRDSLISQLSIDLPHNREALPMEQLKNLVHPARRSNPLVDADHPAVTQVEKLQRNPPRWSVLLPLSHSSSSPSPSDDSHDESTRDSLALDRYRGARLAIDQLEASLNPRGTRESHLRKSVCQLRPILIKVVADCPTELLVASESLKPPVGKEPDSVLLSWLEATARGVAMRLGVPLSTPNAAADSEENVAPNCEEAKQSSKFQELVQMILSIGNAIGPRRLAAPLSMSAFCSRVV